MDVVDPDLADSLTYSKVGGTGPLDVDSTTGYITSTSTVDIDPVRA